eukprot:1193367-Prorocentrum_minimum.AAC.3
MSYRRLAVPNRYWSCHGAKTEMFTFGLAIRVKERSKFRTLDSIHRMCESNLTVLKGSSRWKVATGGLRPGDDFGVVMVFKSLMHELAGQHNRFYHHRRRHWAKGRSKCPYRAARGEKQVVQLFVNRWY